MNTHCLGKLITALYLSAAAVVCAQDVLGFHAATTEPRGDWISFEWKGRPIWVNPDQSVSLLSARAARLESPVPQSGTVRMANHHALYLAMHMDDGRQFRRLTTESVGARIAILHCGILLAAPRIDTPVTGGEVIIHGIEQTQLLERIVMQLSPSSREDRLAGR